MLVYDISNPASPKQINSITLPDFAYGLAAQPGWVAVAMGKSGLSVFSLANPAAPVLATQLGGTFWGTASFGNLLYTAADSLGLMIYDLTRPQSPNFVSITALAAGNELRGDYFPNAFSVSYDPRGIVWLCTSKDGRAYGMDVRAPRQPRHIAEVVTQLGAGACENTAVSKGQLFVAGNNAAFDVNTPQNVGLYEVRQTAPGLVLPDRYNDQPPFASVKVEGSEPAKARDLRKRWPW